MYQAAAAALCCDMHSTRTWAAAIGFAAAIWMAPAALAADPANVVYDAEFEDGKIVSSAQTSLGRESFGKAELKEKQLKETTLPPRGKIQPALLDLLGSSDPSKPVEVVVKYQDT